MSRTTIKPAKVRSLDFLNDDSDDNDAQLVHREDEHHREQDSDEDEVFEEEEEDEVEKDATELELERLVFGDRDGFREGLKNFTFSEGEDVNGDSTTNATGLEGVADTDLFFTDISPEDGLQPAEFLQPAQDDDAIFGSSQAAAWEDSDDERLQVSLATVPRLRKLRRTEDEDVVNGKEYAKRLRQQFQLLNPVPEWARTAFEAPATKRRRISRDEDDSGAESAGDDMDVDTDSPSVAPLSRLLQNAESLTRDSGAVTGKKRKLRPEVIDIERQKDIPGIQPSAITSLSFHPELPLLLSSGPSSTLYLHHIVTSPPALSPNPLLTSLHVKGCELTTTAFHPTDSRIFLSARRRFFHIWDLSTGRVEKVTRVYGQKHEQKSMERFKLSPDGRYMALLGSSKKGGGVLNILDSTTLQWSAQVRAESRGGIAEFAWWRNSEGLCIAGKNGEVTEWSLTEQRVTARWQDEGAVGTTTIALGGQHDLVKSHIGTDRWVAVGSSSGVVNIYDRRAWVINNKVEQLLEHPKPTKALDHLTTPTSNLAFSPDGQILAISSKWKKDALRLVHLPSCTVYRNWPTSNTPLGRITGLAMTDGAIVKSSDVHCVLAVANEQGKIRVWDIR